MVCIKLLFLIMFCGVGTAASVGASHQAHKKGGAFNNVKAPP
jgi:hypothetical protein